MVNEPTPPRWSNPAEDASFAAATLAAFGNVEPIPPMTPEESDMLRTLMIRAEQRGDSDLVVRLQWFATNPLGFREFLRQGTPATT